MAKVTLAHPFDEIHGALSHGDKIINRQKKYRDERGKVIFVGVQEAYAVKHPRDWDKTPKKGAELANFNCWSEACRRAAQILFIARLENAPLDLQPQILADEQNHRRFNAIPDYYTLEEARQLYALFQDRYQAQIPGKRGTHPDAAAPKNPLTGTGKRYAMFPSFLRAIIYHELKTNHSA